MQAIYGESARYFGAEADIGNDAVWISRSILRFTKIFLFCVNGFEFLLPDEVFNSMIEKAKVGNLGMADVEWVQRVQNLFKNLLEKVPLRFMLPTNSIVRYLETGNINLTDFPYQMTIEERKLHIKHVLQLIQSNPNITFGVLLPTTEKYSGTNFINLSFNTSYSTGIFKEEYPADSSGYLADIFYQKYDAAKFISGIF